MQLAVELRQCRLGNLASTILYSHSPWLYKLVPQMLGVECWREGASEHLTSLLHDLGMVACSETSRTRVDAISLTYDHELKVWRQEVEVSILFLSCKKKIEKGSIDIQ